MYKKAVSSDQMRRADKNAEELFGISEEILIENAAQALLEECPLVKSAVILCGTGNNGADGYALARKLFFKGTDVRILTLDKANHKNSVIDEKLGIKISDFYEKDGFEAELYVDALFGTGLSRPVNGKAAEMIEYFNNAPGFKLSVDIPSGVDSDTGAVLSCAVKADKTVTFAFAKVGLYQYPGKGLAGEIVIKDISLPDTLGDTKSYIVFGAKEKKRRAESNKGDYGHLFTLCGSETMAGAAYMSAAAAVKSGCGLVTAGVPDIIKNTVASMLPEAMAAGLLSEEGAFSPDALAGAEKYFERANTLLIGCGIRNTEKTAYLVREAVNRFAGKNIVIDADGLNALQDEPRYFENTVITPHPGEMARLMNTDTASVQKDRAKCALSFSEKYGCVVVLKGAATVTAYPDGCIYINTTGNPGMANGGSGDVLAGLTASFLAQGIEDAPVKAAFIHGLAGDFAKEKYGEGAYSATDIIKMMPRAIKTMYD